MPKRAVLSLKVEGAELLAKRLDPDHLMNRPIGALVEEAGRLGQKQAAKRAPSRSGRLAAAVVTHSFARSNPPYATLSVAAVARDGFRYGFALDASQRYHYRGRKPATKGWFSKVPAIIRRLIRQQLRRAEQAIEAQFAGPAGGVR